MANEKQARNELAAATQVGAAFLVAGTEEIARLTSEITRLREQVRIATVALEAIGACDKASGGERYPGACATFAHDALIQMSVVA